MSKKTSALSFKMYQLENRVKTLEKKEWEREEARRREDRIERALGWGRTFGLKPEHEGVFLQLMKEYVDGKNMLWRHADIIAVYKNKAHLIVIQLNAGCPEKKDAEGIDLSEKGEEND